MAKLKSALFQDIRFWILLFFIIRMIGITNPPLEVAHNWRQVTTNMYARNFLEIDNNILYARVDHAGELTGITAKEFPVYNYLIYLLSLLFGFQHWFGRLISLVFGSIGIWFFYKIVGKYVDKKLAFSAGMLLLLSSWLMCSRKIMPGIFSISLVIIGIYYALEYFYSKKRMCLLWYFILAGLGVLSKLPSIYLLAVLLIPFLDKKVILIHKAWFAIFSGIILTITYIWYFKWIPHLVEAYGFEHFPMRSFVYRSSEIFHNLDLVTKRFYFSSFFSYIAFIVSLIGLILTLLNKKFKLLLSIGLPSLVFFFFILSTGRNFYHHSYYIVPFVPVLALTGAYAISKIKHAWIVTVLFVLIGIETSVNQYHDFIIQDKHKYILELEDIANEISKPSDLIAINTGFNPQQLYFTHRKGWALTEEETKSETKIQEIKNKGCQFLFINKNYAHPPFLGGYEQIFENNHYIVYKL